MATGLPDHTKAVKLFGVDSLGNLIAVLCDDQGRIITIPYVHHSTHEQGGSDEIDVTGLSGVLADYQKAKVDIVTTKVNFPAAGTPNRLAYATDEGILYYDNGSVWVKASVKDHADLDGTTSDDHHPKLHAADHAPAGVDDVHPHLDLASFLAANRPHSALSGIGSDDHHPKLHQADHQSGGADALPWGSGGGLDADKVDGYEASQLGGVGAWTSTTTISAGTVYQNGNTKAILVVRCSGVTGNYNRIGHIKTDASNPPTTIKARFNQYAELVYNSEFTLVCPIQPNHYYLIELTNASLGRAELFSW